MKWASILAVVFIVLALIVETIFIIHQVGDQQRLSFQILGLEQNLTESENKNETLNGDNAKANKEIEELTIEKNQQIATNADLEKKLEEKIAYSTELLKQNSTLEKKFLCEKSLSGVDFTDNETVNQSLKKYVRDTKNRSEPVSASYWSLIWTGDKYSIHTVEAYSEEENMNYIWKFTVYFNGESYGDHKDGIFYNDGQCWLYLDK